MNLVTNAGEAMVRTLVEIFAGCLISLMILSFGKNRHHIFNSSFVGDIVFIAGATLFGMLLPIGTYGLVPVLGAMLFIGVKYYSALVMVISNALFNILTPVNDPSFVWVTGYRRIFFAFFSAIMVGLVLKISKMGSGSIIKDNIYHNTTGVCPGFKSILSIFKNVIDTTGTYIIAGVIVNVVFNNVVLWKVLSFLSSNPHTNFIPRFFAGYDVVNPFFLLAMSVVYLFMDFIKMSAMLVIFKPKGLLLYLFYYLSWIVLLGASAFI